jgi:hypothetical protein
MMRPEEISSDLYDLVDVMSGEFEGLELPLVVAREVRRTSERRKALVPSRYRTPRVSLEEARSRAESVLRDRQHRYQDVTFGDVEIYAYHPMVYTLVTFSPEWQHEGRVPGGLICSIDKVDGHVWTTDEQEQYATTNASD